MKLLLFDLDGTLVSTGGAGLRALDKAFSLLHGIEEAMKGVSPAGKTDPAIVREVFEKKLGRSPANGELPAVCEAYLDFLPEEVRSSPDYLTMEGIRHLLEALRRDKGALLGLGTGNLERGARIKLERAGLNEFFAFGGFGSDAEERAEVLKVGVARAEKIAGVRIAPENVYVIGDTILDVRAGKRIGAVTVAVACGHGNEVDLRQSNPDIFLPSFEDPTALLKSLGNSWSA